MASVPRIAILGAGPAGLTLARLLQHRSIPCSIFERDPDHFARSQGGSLDLHEGSAQLALKEAGLYEHFLKHARPEGEVLKIYDPQNRILLNEGEEGGGGRPGEFKGRPEIDRVKLRELLLDSIEPKSISWARKLKKIEPAASSSGDEGAKKHDLHFTDGGVEKGFDVVVGAEGAWSKVRESLTDQKPFYSGIGGLDLKLSDIDRLNPAVSKRVGAGMCLTLGENRGLLAQRNGDGAVRCYAFVRQPESAYDKFAPMTATNPKGVKKEMLEEFYADWHPEAKTLVLNSDDEVYVRPMYMLPIGFRWKGNPGITLVGDAAHLMPPFAGVGVNVAMQDALELSQAIVSSQDNGGWSTPQARQQALAAALRRYEEPMWKRAEENAQATAMYLDLFFHPRGGHAMIEHFEQAKAKEAQAELAAEKSAQVQAQAA